MCRNAGFKDLLLYSKKVPLLISSAEITDKGFNEFLKAMGTL